MSGTSLVRTGGGVLVAGAIFLASVVETEAIPAFARKYRTSCQTCHVVYPKLTPFGEAFRLNAFRFPEGRDAEFTKDEPVRLGAEGYKRLWPKSVWPGDIPGGPPVAFVLATEAKYEPDATTRSQVAEVEAELLVGGTMGENISFYGEVEFGLELETDETELGVERAYVSFKPWVNPVLALKVGLFEPGIALVSNHRRITGARYWLTRPPAGLGPDRGAGIENDQVLDNEFRLESPAQAGIEFWGIFSHRGLWNAGYVEGRFNEPNNSKDAYVRIAGKWGGMRLDGTVKEGEEFSAEKPQPWREVSVTASAFAYRGTATLDAGPPEFKDDFTIVGADVQVNLKDLIIHAGISRGNNDNPDIEATAFTDVDSEVNFAELDWVALPWLVPALRYETYELTDGFADDKRVRWVPSLNFLIRANVLAFVTAEVERERFGNFNTEEIEGGLVIAF